jgi:hypothetical protein
MAVINWPTSGNFPQVPQKGFQETGGINILRSPMDKGPAKQRLRGSKPNTMQLSFIMTTQQTQTLETFIKTTIRGTKRFNFPHPRLGTQVECRLVPQQDGEFYTLQYLAPGYWQTSLTFEILP